MCNKRSASSGKAPLMFQICLTSEKSAALQSWQQELLFFSGSFPHACCMQSKDILSTASQTYPETPACWDKGTPSPAGLVQPVLGRHVLTQRTQSSFSFLFPCHPASMSPSLARASIQEHRLKTALLLGYYCSASPALLPPSGRRLKAWGLLLEAACGSQLRNKKGASQLREPCPSDGRLGSKTFAIPLFGPVAQPYCCSASQSLASRSQGTYKSADWHLNTWPGFIQWACLNVLGMIVLLWAPRALPTYLRAKLILH